MPEPIPQPHPLELIVDARTALLQACLDVSAECQGIVLFAHGSGSSRLSPRNQHVAQALRQQRLGTLLIDLLTEQEALEDAQTAQLRFDIDLLAERLLGVIRWLRINPLTRELDLGLFGASTGSAAALVAAAKLPHSVAAIVSRGGRPDLAGAALRDVRAPTLLIVGELDQAVLALNRRAARELPQAELVVVPGATHLFEEPGRLDVVAELAGRWFGRHLGHGPQ